jgi:hypothetical protein
MRIRHLALGTTCALLATTTVYAQTGTGTATPTTLPTAAKPTIATSVPATAAGSTRINGSPRLPGAQTMVGGSQKTTATDASRTGMAGPQGANFTNGGRSGVREGDDGIDTERGVENADGSSAIVSPDGGVREDTTPQSTPDDAPTEKSTWQKAKDGAETGVYGAAEKVSGVIDPLADKIWGKKGEGQGMAGARGTPDDRPTYGTNTLNGPPAGPVGGDPGDGANGQPTGGGVSAANGGTVNLGNRAGGDAPPGPPKPPEGVDTSKLNNGASDPTRR